MSTHAYNSFAHYGLVADIGGTNIRFGVVDLDDGQAARIHAPDELISARYNGIVEAAQSYLEALKIGRPPSAVAFAMAGPVNDEAITLTNSRMRGSRDKLRAALHVDRVSLVNDYEAIARAIPLLQPGDAMAIGPALPPQPHHDHEMIAIVGPGTGLGVAGFLRAGKTITPLVTEGGHVGFAPSDDVEIEILKILARRFGHVSTERILSGPGLRNLYEALAAIEGVPVEPLMPEEITRRAEDDPKSFCGRVFERFCAILGTVAGDVALTMGARDGVFITGGILPDLSQLFAASAFRKRFEAKGRFEDYMKKIPTRLVLQKQMGLLGAASLLAPNGKA